MIQRVTVVGAGTMGLGIAQVCALSGFTTLLYDVNEEQVIAAQHAIRRNLSRSVERGKLTAQKMDETLARIRPVMTLGELKADLLIEAAAEKLEIKQQLFSSLENINEGKMILASNTSSISIARIGEGLKDPTRCIGLHFFNPADRMQLVEIISSKFTDPEVVEEIRQFSLQIGKTTVAAKDSPGFIVNRVARHYYGESLKLLEENAGTVLAVDALLRSAGFKMGPFELMDLIGVETNLAVTKSVYEGFNKNPKFKPSLLQQKLVDEGNFGRKTGKGFYEYSGK